MSQYPSIIKGLEASRRIGAEIDLDKHKQDLERTKLQRELSILSESRRNFVETEIAKSRKEYEENLKADQKIRSEFEGRQKRSEAEMAKVAQQDFEKDRERLINERNKHDELDRHLRIIEKKILDLKSKSRFASEDEDRLIRELTNRKQVTVKLLQESKQREQYHYEQSKQLSAF